MSEETKAEAKTEVPEASTEQAEEEKAEGTVEKVSASVRAPSVEEVEQLEGPYQERARKAVEALEAKLEKQRQRAIVSALRQMGARVDMVSDADLLALAPRVDPDEPDGKAALLKFREGRGAWFKRADVGPQEKLGELKRAAVEDKGLPAHLRERKARMLSRVYGDES